MRKILSIILIIIGIVIIIYPKTMEMYYDCQQGKLVKEWENSISNIEQGGDLANHNKNLSIDKTSKLLSYGTELELNHGEIQSRIIEMKRKSFKKKWDSKKLEEEENKKNEQLVKRNIEGILKIEKIDLELPILSGATKSNLEISVSSINNTGKPGEIGNYSIAGHRSHTYGRHFNRLGEIEKGDIIEVVTGDAAYTYKVYDIFTVDPGEIWVLRPDGNHKEITLITCEPMINPTRRLIVRGRIEK